MCVGFVSSSMSTYVPPQVPGVQRGHKRASDPLELEIQMVINHREGAKNLTCVLQQPVLYKWRAIPLVPLIKFYLNTATPHCLHIVYRVQTYKRRVGKKQ